MFALRHLATPANFVHRCVRNNLTNEGHIVPAAKAGDGWTLSVIREATLPLASVLATAVQLCGLHRIVVIGGFAGAMGKTYETLLDDAIRQYLAPKAFGALDRRFVEVRSLTEEACLCGAALFARTQSLPCVSSS
jgi:predicted NBD/HSP70 family sugar kinase